MKYILKRIAALLLAVFTLLTITLGQTGLTTWAATGDYPRLIDAADLLTDQEEADLLKKLDEISERQEVDVTLITVDEIEQGYTVESYADGLYEACGYGYGALGDGLMLMLSMGERDWYITTQGYGITAFTDYGIQYIGEKIRPDLSGGHYAKAFDTYADMADDFITRAKEGNPFDVGQKTKAPFPWHVATPISFVIGWFASLIKRGSLRGELKSVKPKKTAGNYTRKNSMQLTESREIYLYKNVSLVKIEHEDRHGGGGGSSTHVSSSGTTHGGGGGKF